MFETMDFFSFLIKELSFFFISSFNGPFQKYGLKINILNRSTVFRFSGEVTNKRNLVTLFSQPKCIHVSDIPFSDSLLEKKKLRRFCLSALQQQFLS